MKKYFLGYSFCLIALVGFANTDSTKKFYPEFLIFENYAIYNNVKDQKISNLLYSGAGLGFGNSSEQYRDSWRLRLLQAAGMFTFMQPYTKTTQVFNPRIDIGFWAYYDLQNFGIGNSNSKIFSGGSIYLIGNFKIIPNLGNSLLHAEVIPFLQIPLWLEKNITLKNKPFVLFSKLDLPLYGYLFQIPAYSLPGFDFLNRSHLPFWRFQRVNLEVGLQRQLPNLPNQWRLSYQWEFYHFKKNEVFHNYTVYHYLKLAWMLKRK